MFVQHRRRDGTLSASAPAVFRGFAWSPHTAGADPANLDLEHIAWREIDLQMMQAAGVTAIRTYHDFGTTPEAFHTLDLLYNLDIGLIVQVDSPRHGTNADLANIATIVSAYRNHPAILMWAVGNEWDLNLYFGAKATLADAAAFTEQAARLIKSLDSHHPVATIIADPHIPGRHPLSRSQFPFLAGPYTEDIVRTLVPSVDVWGLNLYRGDSFQDVFQQWQSISTKPMFVSEFGADSYDHRSNRDNPDLQAEWNSRLWDEVFYELSAERTAGTALGALAMEWNDEWWKNGAPAAHNVSVERNFGQPDGVNDEEWLGHVDVHRNAKSALLALQNRFLRGQAATGLNGTPRITVTSQDGGNAVKLQLDDKTVFRRVGGADGARGITVAALDSNTGIRLREVRSFDTWYPFGGPHVAFQTLIEYLNAQPNGSVLLLAIGDEGGFVNPGSPNQLPWSDPNVEAGYRALEMLGSTKIRTVGYQGGWAMICVKGQGMLAEVASPVRAPAVASATISITLNPDFGRR